MGFPKRGEIYLVNFDPTIGHEVKKARPAVVITNNNNINNVQGTGKFQSPLYPVHPVKCDSAFLR